MAAIGSLAHTVGQLAENTLDFETVLREYQAMVFSLAYHFLRDHSIAEELAQEVFLDLYRNLNRVRSREHLVYWLRKVTSRRCIDQARRRKVRSHVSLEDAPEPFAWMPAEDPALKRYIQQLLGKLAETPRMIVILRYQEGLEPAEIAEILDMPIATVKSHLQRSLALLRQKVTVATGEGRQYGF